MVLHLGQYPSTADKEVHTVCGSAQPIDHYCSSPPLKSNSSSLIRTSTPGILMIKRLHQDYIWSFVVSVHPVSAGQYHAHAHDGGWLKLIIGTWCMCGMSRDILILSYLLRLMGFGNGKLLQNHEKHALALGR